MQTVMYVECHELALYTDCNVIMLDVIVMNVIMLGVIMPSVKAPSNLSILKVIFEILYQLRYCCSIVKLVAYTINILQS